MATLLRSLAIACGGSLVLTLAIATAARSAEADSIEVAGTRFVFASPEQGRTLLSTRDAYIERLSPFDRQSRRQHPGPVNEADYLDFIRGEVRPWSPEHRERITGVLRSLDEPLSKLSLPSIGEVQLVHTTGREESGAAYTRGTAIILPVSRLSASRESLMTLIAHELFHVISRSNPELRDELYALIGFTPSNEIALPDSLADRRITNPDAPVIEHLMRLKISEDAAVIVAPVLFAKREYDPQSQKSMFAYLDFQLMEVTRTSSGDFVPVLRDGGAVFHPPSEPDFLRQIGGNTSYIIHPEEVLADNFAMLVTGKADLPDPALLDGIRATLRTWVESAATR